MQFQEDHLGLYVDKTLGQTQNVRRFTWKSSSNVIVQVITYGATITSIQMPDKNGNIEDIVTGFEDMNGYLNPLNPYFGATVGRVANRIGHSQIQIGGNIYELTANLGKHQLHGGLRGFDKVNWNHYVKDTKVFLSYLSKDGEEGFPGDVLTTVEYQLTEKNELHVNFKATSTKPTYVNLTNHTYFNLAGHDKGSVELYKHEVAINADLITKTDEDSIPTGELAPVVGTVFDLRIPRILGDVIHNVPGSDGFDHNFCVTKGTDQMEVFVARVHHAASGRLIEIYSNQPGVQFYTGNFLPKIDDKKLLVGKNGAHYTKHGALCFETQNFPDAIHHSHFPKSVLFPGETYHHTVTYKLYIK